MLRDEIIPYLDKWGLVAPSRHEGTGESDNGTMYLGEFFTLLYLRGELEDTDKAVWLTRVGIACMLEPGLTIRKPGDFKTDSPDNMLGILSGSQAVGCTSIPEVILEYGKKHWGFFNPSNPGKFTKKEGGINWEAFLWRQPQLLTAALAASNRLSLLHLPLVIYTALVILYAAIASYPTSEADPRRLCWLLIQIMKPHSLLCRWASKLWYRKLYKDYPGEGMRGVARVYYQAGHPFIKYFVD